MTNWIGISLGDLTGIGPEVALKAIASEDSPGDYRYLIIGDAAHVQDLNKSLGLGLRLQPFDQGNHPGHLFLFDPLKDPLPNNLPPGAPQAARAAVAWVREGAERCLRGELDALVTAPVNKESIVRAGIKFVGQTEFLSELAGTERTAMMLLGSDDRGRWVRVVLATTHLPLRAVPDNLTSQKIELAIEL